MLVALWAFLDFRFGSIYRTPYHLIFNSCNFILISRLICVYVPCSPPFLCLIKQCTPRNRTKVPTSLPLGLCSVTIALYSAVQMAPFPCQPESEGVQWDDSLFGVAIKADARCAFPAWPHKQATSYVLTKDILGLSCDIAGENQSCIRIGRPRAKNQAANSPFKHPRISGFSSGVEETLIQQCPCVAPFGDINHHRPICFRRVAVV